MFQFPGHRGHPTAEIARVELTAAERRAFLRRQWSRQLDAVALVVVCSVCGLLALRFARAGDAGGLAASAALSVVFLVGIVTTVVKRTRAVREKEIVRGIVTNKRRTYRRPPTYFVTVGDSESLVELSDWRRLHLGDVVEVHRTQHKKEAFVVYRHRSGPNDVV